MTGWMKAAGLLALFGLTIFVTSWISRLPESNCTTSQLSQSQSPDHVYNAALLEKNCNKGETWFYSVRIEAHSPPSQFAWVSTVDLDNDDPDRNRPVLAWSGKRRLEITAKTKTLVGELAYHAADDLTVVRKFLPASPNAFPNDGIFYAGH